MVHVIEPGVLPKDRVYQARCNQCETLFEFGPHDLTKFHGEEWVKCPTTGCSEYHVFWYCRPANIDTVVRVK